MQTSDCLYHLIIGVLISNQVLFFVREYDETEQREHYLTQLVTILIVGIGLKLIKTIIYLLFKRKLKPYQSFHIEPITISQQSVLDDFRRMLNCESIVLTLLLSLDTLIGICFFDQLALLYDLILHLILFLNLPDIKQIQLKHDKTRRIVQSGCLLLILVFFGSLHSPQKIDQITNIVMLPLLAFVAFIRTLSKKPSSSSNPLSPKLSKQVGFSLNELATPNKSQMYLSPQSPIKNTHNLNLSDSRLVNHSKISLELCQKKSDAQNRKFNLLPPCEEESQNWYKKPKNINGLLDQKTLDSIPTGIIIFDQELQMVQKNKSMDQIIQQKFSSVFEILDINVEKISKLAQSILEKATIGNSPRSVGPSPQIPLIKFQMSSQSIQKSRPSALSIYSKKSLKELLKDLISNREGLSDGAIIHILQVDQSISLSNFMIRVNHLPDINSDTQNEKFMLTFDEVSERDIFHQRQYSFKIMHQLFQSFQHEFGTSINYLLALAQVAVEYESVSQEIRSQFFLPILHQGKIMHSQVQDMLDYNAILGKQFRLNLAHTNIRSLVEEVQSLFQSSIQQKNVKFLIHLDDSVVQNDLVVDQQRIQQVLISLIQNAQKFTYSGHIIISVRRYRNSYRYIEFVVEDTGIGMKHEEKERLQQLLRTGVKSMEKISPNTAGFGIGLYISNKISENLAQMKNILGGGVQFESTEGRGSRFWFKVLVVHQQVGNHEDQTASPMREMDFKSFIDLRETMIRVNSNRTKTVQNLLRKTASYKKGKATISMRGFGPQPTQISNYNPSMKSSLQIRSSKQFPMHSIELIEKQNVGDQEIQKSSEAMNSESDDIVQEISIQDIEKRLNQFQYLPRPKTLVKMAPKTPTFTNEKSPKTPKKIRCKCNKFLIVDDEQFNILGMKLILKTFGFDADHTMNGDECLKKIQFKQRCECSCLHSKDYSVIFMDINMPLMDGFTATQIIKSQAQFSNLKAKIIACTAFTDTQTKLKCYDVGMDYIINKPVRKEELQRVFQYLELL